MRRIVVTGANKGIGLAIVEAILRRDEESFVYLGSRDLGRGRAARESLIDKDPAWGARVEVVSMDVTSDTSVAAAMQAIVDHVPGDAHPLYAVVNNAGVGLGSADLRTVLEVNTLGMKRVCEAALPLLDPAQGRIVNITSASGPNFVSACSAERQRFLIDRSITWERLRAFIDECLAVEGGEKAFRERGLGDGNAYGLSKACANAYTLLLARQQPQLKINACTPGFIETDLTRPYAEEQGVAPSELGMKPPAEGTRSTLFLLFDEPEGNGRYYGSDALRSPLDRYRSPGDPPYAGD